MKKNVVHLFLTLITAGMFLQSCKAPHELDATPKKPGKYPDFSERIKLLGTMTKYRSCFDVNYYNIDVKIDPANKTVGGTVKMVSTAVSDFDTLQIDLYPNMNLKTVISDLGEVKFMRKEGAIFITMPHTVTVGKKFELTVTYDGSPIIAKKPPWDGGMDWSKDDLGNPWIGVACETEGASLWWPCKDHNSDEADSVDISVTVPDGLMAVCNGQLLDSSEVNGWKKFHWHVSYDINNYDVTFYIGKFKLMHDTYTGINGKTLDLNHYVLPQNWDKAKTQFEQVKDVLKFYETTFGEYPWYRDGFKLVNSPYEGMEHQTAIAYGSNFKNFSGLDFDYIIVHETAHEWWGNAITAQDFSDVWLQEGFATYSEALYVESKYNIGMYYNYLQFYRMQNMNARPMVGPVGVRYFDYHDEDVYTKGTGTLETLRATINNDSVFFGILKTYFAHYRYHQITSEEFISVVNEKTGQDYHWFFNQYLHNRLIPTLEYSWDSDGKFAYRWKNCNSDFKMSIVLDCGTSTQTMYPTTTLQHDKLFPGIKYTQFSVDSNHKLYKFDYLEK